MFTRPEVILYGAWTLLALVLAAASLAVAIGNRRRLARGVPLLFLLATGALLPLGFAAAVACLEGRWWTILPAALFPLLALLAAWLHLHALRGAPFPVRLLALPATVVNLLLAAAWAVRLFHLGTGWDPGALVMSLPLAGVLVQTVVGHPEAVFLPALVHLPLLIPPYRNWRRLTGWLFLLLAAIPAAGLLVVWGAYMPQAHRIARECRGPGKAEKPVLRADQRLLLRHGPTAWTAAFLPRREAEREALLATGARGVLLVTGGEVAGDPEALGRLREEADWARDQGLEVVLAAHPAGAWLTPPPPLKELARRMKELHWTLAVEIRPAVLVLWWEPILLGAETLAAKPAPADWARTIRRSVRDLRANTSGVETALCLGSPHPECRDLLTELVGGKNAPDRIGFTVVPYKRGLTGGQGFRARLDQVRTWIASLPRGREFHILRTGTSPAPVGGEAGQARILAEVLSWAAAHRRIRTLTIHSLTSHTEDLGLITPTGRKRPALDLLPGRGE